MRLTTTTWNVNSIRRRLDGVARLAAALAPDVVCLQETKAVDDAFPADALRDIGYPHQYFRGMKSYNGVAILSRLPLSRRRVLDRCGRSDCRHIAARVDVGGQALEVHSLYVPAGGDLPDAARNPRFRHKLDYLAGLAGWSRRRTGGPAVVAGDFNVAPLETDVWSHERLKNVVTHTPIEIAALERFRAAGGWVDAVRRIVPPDRKLFTWWSYRTPDWSTADKGRRLDHAWVSPELAGRVAACEVLREARGWPEPSDHVPLSLVLDFGDGQGTSL